MNLKKLWQWGCTGPWIEKEQDTEYKYIIEDTTLKITFMGSSNFTTKGNKIAIDWKQNFSFWAKPYRDMKPKWFVHKGFKNKWKIIEDEIHQLIKDNSSIKKIILTGFSQGAAIAGLAHESIWYNFPLLRNNINTVVFGCPRFIWFFNKRKIEDRWNNFTRIENGWDVVTTVPPIIFGYSHVGKKVKIGRKWWQISFRFKHNHLRYGDYL